jgi:polyhydroxyalkanoate synthesis regulator phasin
MAADEAKKVMDKLVARGEIAEKDAKAVLEKIAASRPGQAARKAVKAADRGVEAVLDRLRLPTRDEMDALQKKLDALNAKLDKLTGGGA